MIIAAGSAGATVAVVLGILAVPVLGACDGDSRGLITCMRDLVQQRFDLPETIRGEARSPRDVVPVPEPRSAGEMATELPLVEVPEALPETATPVGQGGPLLPPQPTRPDYAPRTPERIADLEPTRANEPPPHLDPPAATRPEPRVHDEAAPVEAAETTSPPPTRPDRPLDRELSEAPQMPSASTETADPGVPSRPPRPERAATPEPQGQPPVMDTEQATADEPSEAEVGASPADALESPPPSSPRQLEQASEPPAATPPQELVVAAGPEPEPLQPVTPPAAAPLALAPTIDAIELDGARSFVSGSGPAGALMRLFSDDEMVGESPVEAGRWLVETGPLLTVPKQELKIEAFDPETGRSLGQSAITLEIELPVEPPLREEEADPAPPPPAETPPPAPPPGPRAPEPEPEADPEFDTTADASSPAAEAEAPSTPTVAPPTADRPVVAPPSAPAPVILPSLVPVTPQRETTSVSILGAVEQSPSIAPLPLNQRARDDDAETPDRPGQSVSLVRIYNTSDPVYGRFSGGRAIVRRGDTLWTLARRYYGAGIHYRTILEANRHQIRRSTRIFPGQVLDLPLVTRD